MEGMIKVAPETLASTASEFGGQATQLQGLTTQMMELIESLSASWNGEASNAYLAKFRGWHRHTSRQRTQTWKQHRACW